MATAVVEQLADIASDKGVRYFLISFVDLAGVQRAKLVPASAIGGMQRDGGSPRQQIITDASRPYGRAWRSRGSRTPEFVSEFETKQDQ